MKNVLPYLWLLAAAILLVACQGASQGSLEVKDAWARPGTTGGTSAVYFVINNPGGQADKLLSAETDLAEAAELHESSMDAGGTMSMHPQEFIEVPAGEQVSLQPGGLHVMLINLQSDLQPGQNVPLTLHFESAGTITLEAPVREP